jgi:hypothetical protein
MDTGYKRLTEFLVQEGVGDVAHTHKTYMGHLIALYRMMAERGCSEEACRAGMFHSIYGTERFQGFKLGLDRRPEVRALIGERAERLAYINCAMDRASFDRALTEGREPYRVRDRISGEEHLLTRDDFDDLCRVHLYDWLEQVPRSREWGYRRPAYRGIAERLGAAALEEYQRVYSAESASPTPASGRA